MSITDQLMEQIVDFWTENDLLRDSETVVVGVSGGVDSLVLCHVLSRLRERLNIKLHMATLDHGLRGQDGISDADYVEKIATEWAIPITRGTMDVAALMDVYGLNLEEAARQARYSFLLDVAQQQDATYIAVGHNRDDQAETVLMHVIRGTGLSGLRGMLPTMPLSEYHILDEDTYLDMMPEDYFLIRPLLNTPRAMIQQYADATEIQPRQDATNDDLTRFRNSLRHEILPHLAQLNPNIHETLTRLAHVVQGDVEVLQSRIESVAAWMLEWADTEPVPGEEEGGEVVYIDRSSFREQPRGVQRGVIRKALNELAPDVRDFSFEQTETIRNSILTSHTSDHIDLPAGLYLSIGYDEAMLGYGGAPFYPEHLPSLKEGQFVALDLDGQGYISGNQRLITYWVVEGLSQNLYPTDPLECTLSIPENSKLALRTRQAGDRFRPFGLSGKSQKLSDTFTNLKVPAYYRDQVPLLTVDGEIAWFVVPTALGPVGRIADPFAVRPESNSILRVRWQIDSNPLDRDE